MNKMIRLMESGMAQCQSGDLKGACDKFIAAVLAAPKVWDHNRFKAFMMHCTILRELHFKASDAQIKTLRKQFLQNKREPPHFRVQTGVLYSRSLGERSE